MIFNNKYNKYSSSNNKVNNKYNTIGQQQYATISTISTQVATIR